METPPAESRCQRCQVPIPVDAPVPFCPPCIAAGALRPVAESPDAAAASGLNWPAIGLVLVIIGILGVLIFQSAQQDLAPEGSTVTNAPSQTNPPPAPNPLNP